MSYLIRYRGVSELCLCDVSRGSKVDSDLDSDLDRALVFLSVFLPFTPHFTSSVPSSTPSVCNMKDGKQRAKPESLVPSGRGTYAKQACSHCRKRCASSCFTSYTSDPFDPITTHTGRANATVELRCVVLVRRQAELQRCVNRCRLLPLSPIIIISLAYMRVFDVAIHAQ